MEAKLIWLLIFVGLYWAYCLFWGFRGALRSRTSADYFVAGRSIGIWVFVLAATATSFSGWTFVGHPGLILEAGLPYAFASFYALTIPFTGVLFLRRQWLIGRAFQHITPGEMYSHYYGGDTIRLLTVLVAFLFSVPYLGVQLRASGFLFNVLSDNMLSVEVGMFALSAIVMIYVAAGGLRSVAYVDCAQCILLALGIVALGIVAIQFSGGWTAFTEGVGNFVRQDVASGKGLTPDGHSHYVALPGSIQMVSEGSKAVGGVWTGMMCMTYMFALMGIQSSPAFSMWAFSNRTSEPFRWQQVVASSLIIGIILFTFTIFQGLGGNVLLANGVFDEVSRPELVPPVDQPSGGQLPVAGGIAGRMCAGRHAEHRGGLYVHVQRDGDPGPLQAIRIARRIRQNAEALRPHFCNCRNARGAHRGGKVDAGHRDAGRARRGLRIPDVSGADGAVLFPLLHTQRHRLGAGRRAGCRHAYRPYGQ